MEPSSLIKRSRNGVLSKQIYQELNRTNKEHSEKSAKLQQMYDVLKTVKRRKTEKNMAAIAPKPVNNTVASYMKSLDSIGFSPTNKTASRERFCKLPVSNFSSICGDSGYGSSQYKSSNSGKSDSGQTSGDKSDLTFGHKSDYSSDTYSSSESKTLPQQMSYCKSRSKPKVLDIHTISNKRMRFKKTAEALRECGILEITKKTSDLVKEHGSTVSQVQQLAKDMKAFAESVLNDPKNAHLKDMFKHNLNLSKRDVKNQFEYVSDYGNFKELNNRVGPNLTLDSSQSKNSNLNINPRNEKRVPTIHQVSVGHFPVSNSLDCKERVTSESTVTSNSHFKSGQAEVSPNSPADKKSSLPEPALQNGFTDSDVMNDEFCSSTVAVLGQSETDPFVTDQFDSDSDPMFQSDSNASFVHQSSLDFPLFSTLSPVGNDMTSEHSSLSSSSRKGLGLYEKKSQQSFDYINYDSSLSKLTASTRRVSFNYKNKTDLTMQKNVKNNSSSINGEIVSHQSIQKQTSTVSPQDMQPHQFAQPFQVLSNQVKKRGKQQYHLMTDTDNVCTEAEHSDSSNKDHSVTLDKANIEPHKCNSPQQEVQPSHNIADLSQQNVGLQNSNLSPEHTQMLSQKGELSPEHCQSTENTNLSYENYRSQNVELSPKHQDSSFFDHCKMSRHAQRSLNPDHLSLGDVTKLAQGDFLSGRHLESPTKNTCSSEYFQMAKTEISGEKQSSSPKNMLVSPEQFEPSVCSEHVQVSLQNTHISCEYYETSQPVEPSPEHVPSAHQSPEHAHLSSQNSPEHFQVPLKDAHHSPEHYENTFLSTDIVPNSAIFHEEIIQITSFSPEHVQNSQNVNLSPEHVQNAHLSPEHQLSPHNELEHFQVSLQSTHLSSEDYEDVLFSSEQIDQIASLTSENMEMLSQNGKIQISSDMSDALFPLPDGAEVSHKNH